MTVKEHRKKIADVLKTVCGDFLQGKLPWKDLLSVVDHWLPEMKRLKSDDEFYSTTTPLTQAQLHSRIAFEGEGAVLNMSKILEKGSFSFLSGDPQEVEKMIVAGMTTDPAIKQSLMEAVLVVIEAGLRDYGREALSDLDRLKFKYPKAFNDV